MKTVNLIAVLVALAVAGLLGWFVLRPPAATPLLSSGEKNMSADVQSIVLGMGCFWGAEKRLAAIPGVVDVESGYANGDAGKTSYDDVLALEREIKRGRSDARNHAEVIKVTFDPKKVELATILAAFWENHDPTQGMRQGNDIGTAYRSAIYWTTDGQRAAAEATRLAFQGELTSHGYGAITTEVRPATEAGAFYLGEDYHQQYLHKNPGGYCNHGPNGLTCPVGLLSGDSTPAQQDVPPPRG